MKSFDEKWVSNLKLNNIDNDKKFKSICSIKKNLKDNKEDIPRYVSILNEFHREIFYIITDKLAKSKTSTIEKLTGGFISTGNYMPEILEILSDIIALIDGHKIIDMVKSFSFEIFIIFYKLFDHQTKKEFRLFSFKLFLKLCNIYVEHNQEIPEFEILFNYAFDSSALREKSDKPMFHLKFNNEKMDEDFKMLMHEFSDIGKVIFDNSPRHPEECTLEIFMTFIDFVNNHTERKRKWFLFFQQNWMNIYFNDKFQDVTDHYQFFDMHKKTGFTANTAILKEFVSFMILILKGDLFKLEREDRFAIMDKLKYLYWNPNLLEEIDRVLNTYHDYCTKKIKSALITDIESGEADVDPLVVKKIISNLDEILMIYLQNEYSFMMNGYSSSPDKRDDYHLRRDGRENLCLNIMRDILKFYKSKFCNEVFIALKFAIEKNEQQNENIPKSFLFPLIEILFTIAMLSPEENLADYVKMLEKYLADEEILKKIVEIIKNKTLSYMWDTTNDTINTALSKMEIQSGASTYPMRIEYLPQWFLANFCELCKTKNLKLYMYFMNEAISNQCAVVKIKDEASVELCKKVFAEIEQNFLEWFRAILIFYQSDFLSSKSTYSSVCRCITTIIDMLINPDSYAANEIQDKSKSYQRFKHPMPTETFYVHYFLQSNRKQIFWMFFNKTLEVSKSDAIEPKLWATNAYLSIFCNTQSDIRLNKKTIIEAISFIDDKLKWDNVKTNPSQFPFNCFILKSTENIFLTDYPGVRYLLPKYLESIEKIFSGENFSEIDKPVKNLIQKLILFGDEINDSPIVRTSMELSAIRILKSIICMGYALEDMKIATKEGKSLTLGIIREKGFKITYRILETLKNKKENKHLYTDLEFQHNLYTVAIAIIFHECLMTKIERPLKLDISLEDYITTFFQQFIVEKGDLAPDLYNLHIQVVSRMAVIFNPNSKYFSMIFHLALEHLTNKLRCFFKGSINDNKKEVIGELLLVLMRWILHDTRGLLLKSENLNFIKEVITEAEKILEYREYIDIFFKTIMIYYINFPLKNQNRDYIYSIFEEASWKNIDFDYFKYFKPNEEEEDRSPLIPTPETQHLSMPKIDLLIRSDSAKSFSPLSENIKELISKFNYLNLTSDDKENLKKMDEIEQIDFLNMKILTTLPDSHPPNVKYMTYRDNSLLSFIDPSSRTLGGKTIMRNVMGRYAWQFSFMPELNLNILRSGPKDFASILKTDVKREFLYPDTGKKLKAAGSSGQMKINYSKSENPKSSSTEKDDFIEPFQRFYNALKYMGDKPEVCSSIIIDYKLEIKDLETSFEKINKLFEDSKKLHQEKLDEIKARKKKSPEKQKSEFVDLRKIVSHEKDGMTLLLSNLGLLSYFDETPALHLYEAENLQHLSTTISLMDVIPTRETAKCGIIYVARGQDNQKEILQNRSGSETYEKFILKLGKPVPLKSHLGFQAGLKHTTDGEHSIYAANCTNEIMFHVATMMPTKEDDDQVVNKKRHVGNDQVNIIWSENYRPYRRNTISSQYNDFLIIIYPMKNDLYKISIQRKDNKSIIFPWIDDMIVTWDFLPMLINVSVASAYKKYRLQKDIPFQSYKQRNEYMASFQKNGVKTQQAFKRKESLPDIMLSFRNSPSPSPSPSARGSVQTFFPGGATPH